MSHRVFNIPVHHTTLHRELNSNTSSYQTLLNITHYLNVSKFFIRKIGRPRNTYFCHFCLRNFFPVLILYYNCYKINGRLSPSGGHSHEGTTLGRHKIGRVFNRIAFTRSGNALGRRKERLSAVLRTDRSSAGPTTWMIAKRCRGTSP